MGYELTLMVVSKSRYPHGSIALIEDRVYIAYEKDGGLIYYSGPNTAAPVPPESKVFRDSSWCEVVSVLELCKCGLENSGICKFEESDGHYAYLPFNGNDLIGIDCYGSYRKFVPIQYVIDEMADNIREIKSKGETPYRRYVSALAHLKSVKRSFTKMDNMGCLCYGH